VIRSNAHSLNRRALAVVALGGVLAGIAGFQAPAHAVPPAPTVGMAEAADGWVNAAEAPSVTVSGTYAPTEGSVDHILATISEAVDASCTVDLDVAFLTPVTIPVDGTTGTWSQDFDATSLPEGATLCARAVAHAGDGYGPVGFSAEQGVLDVTAPARGTVEMLDPNGDGFMNADETACSGGCIPANWAAADPSATAARVYFFNASEADMPAGCGVFNVGPNGVGAVNATCAANLAEGTFRFRAYWLDDAGNASTKRTVLLVKDTVVDVTIESPASGAEVAPGTALAIGATTEPETDYELRLNGLPFESGETAGGSIASSTDAPLTDGAHVLTVIVTDRAGNTTNATSSFTVDSLIPVITAPAPGSLNPSIVRVAGTGSPGSTVEVLEGSTVIGSAAVTSTGDWTLSSALASGSHTITARAIEGSTVSSSSSPVTFLVSAGRPSVEISTSDLTLFLPGDTIAIDGIAADDATIARVRLRIVDGLRGTTVFDEDTTCEACGTEAAVSWSATPALGPGVFSVVAVAYDDAGNVSAARTIKIISLSL